MSWGRCRWALGISALAAALAAAGYALRHDAQFGTIGEWVAGFGAVIAIGVALREIRAEADTRREQVEREQDAEARRVWVYWEDRHLDKGSDHWNTDYDVELENSSGSPIHGVLITMGLSRTYGETCVDQPIGVSFRTPTPAGMLDVRGDDDRPRVECYIGTLGPGRSWRLLMTTNVRTVIHEVELAWTDPWGFDRLLTIVEGETTYARVSTQPSSATSR